MPLPILAHQAPILPLKLWRPSAFNGTALVLGSIAPDLEYLRLSASSLGAKGFAHSFVGQFVFCLPVTLSVVLLVGRLDLADVLIARLGARFAWLAGAATDVAREGGFKRACMSALVGSFSHLALDALTHRVLPRWLPGGTFRFAHLVFTTPTIVQLVVSGVCALVSLWLLHRISQRAVATLPTPRPGISLIRLLALIGACVGLLRARPAIQNPGGYFFAAGLYVWGYVAFFVACGVAVGILVAGTILAVKDRRIPSTPPTVTR